jgi:hypothetical protein
VGRGGPGFFSAVGSRPGALGVSAGALGLLREVTLMKRKRQAARGVRSRVGFYVLAGTAMAVCLACFTDDGLAASANKGRSIASPWYIHYDCNYFAPNSAYASTEAGQTVEFLGSPVEAQLVALDMEAPTDPSQFILLQPPGVIADGTATQRVAVTLLLGPGSEPFVIDSFFDITYQVVDHGEHMLGPYVAEILSMTLTGHHPVYGDIVLRESPTLASTGELNVVKTTADMKPVLQQSYLDLFLELSIGGGEFVPASDAFRIGYVVPEPGTVGLALVAAAWVGAMRRRRR